MKSRLIKCTLIAVVLLLSGCTSLIADKIENANAPILYSGDQVDALIDKLHIQTQKYCSKTSSFCTEYYYLAPTPLKTSEKTKKAGSIELTGTFEDSAKSVKKSLKLTEVDRNKYKGTVILLHGYGGSKNIWLFTMDYFKFLGFDVIAIDMAGHGAATMTPGFGTNDAPLLNQFINSELRNLPEPVLLIGHSMGAVAAVKTAKLNSSVNALVLLAPMQAFDEATLGVAKTYSPWLEILTPDYYIKKAALRVLSRRKLSVSDTNVMNDLPSLNIPILVYGASDDPISNIDAFSKLNLPEVQTRVNNEESHITPVFVGTKQHEILQRWFSSLPRVNRADIGGNNEID